MEDFILDNLQLLILIAFIVLPILFNRKKAKARKPTVSQAAPGPTAQDSLENKVRKFFEQLVEVEKEPRPVRKAAAPVSTKTPAPPTRMETRAVERTEDLLEQAGIPVPTFPSPKESEGETTGYDLPPTAEHPSDEVNAWGIESSKRGRLSTALRTGLSSGDIKKAIVWKEILDRPVSLKEDRF